MTNFTIPTNTYLKLSCVPSLFKPTTPASTVELLQCVRIEHVKGKSYAIATNQEVASVYYLGETAQPDCSLHITVTDNEFLTLCSTASTVGITGQFVMVDNLFYGKPIIHKSDEPFISDWRKWMGTPPTKSNGRMIWDMNHIGLLAASSPSGQLLFPEHIDVDKPVVIRDTADDNWVGFFIPKPVMPVKKGAVIPSWI